jgi:hypothetical protein
LRKYLILLVPAVGIEPTRSQAPRDFEPFHSPHKKTFHIQ